MRPVRPLSARSRRARRGPGVGTLPVPADTHATAAAHLAARLADAADQAALSPADRGNIGALCARLPGLLGAPEPPARLHGDLWGGNILWAAAGPALFIDPAAHGGHRETDLAMLALFGAPHLDDIVASYQSVSPLAAGWQDRVALHQVHPLLVHAALFGGGYGPRAAAIAASYL
jgi:fructosamine-3-kinase